MAKLYFQNVDKRLISKSEDYSSPQNMETDLI